jgi:amino acid permease
MFREYQCVPQNLDKDNTEECLVAAIGSNSSSVAIPHSSNDALEIQTERGALSTLTAFITIVKCSVGGGSFALPYAFKEGGLYASILLTIALGLLCAHTMDMLFTCERKALQLRNRHLPVDERVSRLSFPEMGAILFPKAVVSLCNHSINLVEVAIATGIFLTCTGVCVSYISFIASIYSSILSTFQGLQFLRDVVLAQWLLLPILLPLVLVRNYQLLSVSSAIGDLAILIGLISVIVYGSITSKGDTGHSDIEVYSRVVTLKGLPSFFGRATFLFAIHIVILPIAQTMHNTSAAKFREVLKYSYACITISNVLFGAVSYILFASDVCRSDHAHSDYSGPCSNILDSIHGSIVLDAIKVLVCIDLLFTIPVVLVVAREMAVRFVTDQVARLVSSCNANEAPTVASCGANDESDEVVIFMHETDAENDKGADCGYHMSNTGSTSPPLSVPIYGLPLTFSTSPFSRYTQHIETIVRVGFVFLLLILASIVSDFGRVVNIVGGVFNAFMGFVVPPLLQMSLSSIVTDNTTAGSNDERGSRSAIRLLHGACSSHASRVFVSYAIMMFGIFIMIVTVYTSIHTA